MSLYIYLVVFEQLWGYSSVGRAPALQAGGQEFESPYLHWMEEAIQGKKQNVPWKLHIDRN